MLPRFAKLLALLALLHICGGHWAVLQTAAWMGMVVRYSEREASLPVAIEKTFDGEHPCGLCKAVAQGRKDERKQEIEKTALKLDAVLAPVWVLPPPAVARRVETVRDTRAEAFAFPPIPPPPWRA